MKATSIYDRRLVYGDREFAEIVIWDVPVPVPPSRHRFKYRLVYIEHGVRVIGFDNERGKGDHRHDNGIESPYGFKGVDQLLDDFVAAVEVWRAAHGKI